MSNSSLIRWKQGDYVSLGRAVSSFNKKINELNAEERKLYLPDEVNYKEIKQNITTRRELKRIINSLRRFNREGAEDLYITKAGEEISKWERRELGIQSRIAQTRLKKELEKLNEPLETGYSRVQMGSVRAREIKAQLKNLKDFENKKGYEFNKLKNRISTVGTSDYEMKKAIIYRENYINEMEKYKSLDNYELLQAKFDELKNPISFYEFMSKDELTVDLTYQSDQFYAQQSFNSFLERLGIDLNVDSVEQININNEINHNYKYSLISRNGLEVSSSDSKQALKNIVLNSNDSNVSNGWIRENY